jgi:hypothetical protein
MAIRKGMFDNAFLFEFDKPGMKQIRISAKNLGAVAMPSFCPRCFWIISHAEKQPFQIFPGIFSSIDTYSKKVTSHYYKDHHKLVKWLTKVGLTGKPVKIPHYSDFNILDAGTKILLTGVPDEIIQLSDGSYAILDYKTAKFTGHQDELMPMYDVQLNAYAYIGERTGFKPVSRLMLIYYEPVTDIAAGEIDDLIYGNGFRMSFSGKTLEIPINTKKIPALLRTVRKIHDLRKPPKGLEDCGDCQALEELIALVSKSNKNN